MVYNRNTCFAWVSRAFTRGKCLNCQCRRHTHMHARSYAQTCGGQTQWITFSAGSTLVPRESDRHSSATWLCSLCSERVEQNKRAFVWRDAKGRSRILCWLTEEEMKSRVVGRFDDAAASDSILLLLQSELDLHWTGPGEHCISKKILTHHQESLAIIATRKVESQEEILTKSRRNMTL